MCRKLYIIYCFNVANELLPIPNNVIITRELDIGQLQNVRNY